MKKKTFKIVAHEAKTLSWWRNRREKIDMYPPYQRRGRLWSVADKAYLVDSLINGFDVPKFYLADFTYKTSPLNSRNLAYAIIDGKQRFEAIFDFFDGLFVLNDDFVYMEDPSRKLAGLGFADIKKLYPDVAETFENQNISVISVISDDEEPINELFVRLNRSKSLTGAEIRNAMRGPVPSILRELAKHRFFTTTVRFSTKRGSDLNAAAKVLLFEYSGGVAETKKKNLDQLAKDSATDSEEKIELAARHVAETLEDLSEIFLPRDSLLSSAGTVPVYYWFIRQRKEDEFHYIREFLVRFERRRKQNREMYEKTRTSKRIDSTLVDYDRYNRSTNDETSHRERVRILSEEFDKWLKEKAGNKPG